MTDPTMFPAPPTNKRGDPMRESIMIFGDADQGKTHLLFTIAKWHQTLGSDAQFYCANTDNSYETLLDNPEFEDLENIQWQQVSEFQESVDLVKGYNRKARARHDWIVLDLAGTMWDQAQDEYAAQQSKRLGVDIDNLGDLWKVENPGGEKHPVEGWEWGPINVRYRRLANNALVVSPAHLFLVYGHKDLPKESSSGDNEDMAQKRGTFKHVGKLPVCQKEDPRRWNTILHVERIAEKQQGIITAKEKSARRRRMGKQMGRATIMRHEPINDFMMDYLVGVAGWRIN